MAEPIIQKLGFETGQAVSNIAAMDEALKGLNRRIARFAKVSAAADAAKMGAAFDDTAAKAKKAAGETDKAFNKMKDGGKKAADGIQKITFAWSGLAKALLARTAVQAITKLTAAILDSANAASEFEITVARISNIAKGPGSGIDELSQSLNALSVQLGRPITEVTEAAFEGLQNDLGNTTETMNFLADAADNLALVTGGTLTQAVNSLSSVIKAYNLPISEAATVSDQFFAAIDKGRISLEELENSLGKITPLAAKLDIEFGQVAGAMAAITQSGTSANVANTQLRSIFQKLLKPTEDLQAAFKKLGVDTFNQLIERSGGLRQALNELAGAFNNDDRAIAKAFGRLRAQLGVFNLLANEGKIFADTMDAVAESSGKAAAGAERIRGTEAFKAKQAWEEYNATIRETGKFILKAQTTLISFFNKVVPDATTLITIFEKVAIAAAAIGGPLVISGIYALTAALWAAAIASKALVAPLLIGAAVGVAIGETFNYIMGGFNREMDRIDETAKGKLEAIKENSKKAIETINKDIENLLKERGQIVDDYIAGMETAFDKETAVLSQAARIVGTALEATISDFESGMNSMIDGMKSKLKGVQKSLAAANVKAEDAKRALEDFDFDKNQRGLSSFQRIDNAMSRVIRSGSEMRKSLRKALSNPEAAGQAVADIARVEDQVAKLRALADASKSPVKAREATESADRLERDALKARKKLADANVQNLRTQATATEQLLNIQKGITAEIAEQLRLRGELVSLLDKNGQLKSPQQQADDDSKLAEIDKNLNKLFGSFDRELFKAFGNQRHADKLVGNVIKGFNAAEFSFNKIDAGIEKVLSGKDYQVFVDVVANIATSGDEKIDEAVQAAVAGAGRNVVKQTEAARKVQAASLKEMKTHQQAYKDSIERSATAMVQLKDKTKVTGDLIGSSIGDGAQKVLTEIEGLEAKLLDPSITAEKATQIENIISRLQGKVATMFDKKQISSKLATAMVESLDAAEAIIKERQLAVTIKPKFDTEVIKTLEAQIRGTMASGVDGANETATAVGTITTALGVVQTNISSAIVLMNALGVAADAAGKKVAAAAAAGEARYHGGMVAYRAAGGPTRGLDTQMTATSPGEFVMNARSARQWSSQLQAMNAGQSPQYRDKGGPVTNIGDINVNVTSDTSVPAQAGREIASTLRRELRRGTSTI